MLDTRRVSEVSFIRYTHGRHLEF